MEKRILNIVSLIKIYNVKTIQNQNFVQFYFLGKKYEAVYYTSDLSIKLLIAKDVLNFGINCFNSKS